jgi:hypothetical protein
MTGKLKLYLMISTAHGIPLTAGFPAPSSASGYPSPLVPFSDHRARNLEENPTHVSEVVWLNQAAGR